MNIAIIEKSSGKTVTTVEVLLRGLNYDPAESEFFAEAWSAAVEDGLVDEADRQKYQFKVVP